MTKLIIDKSIEINASAAKVWNAITERKYSDKWTSEFLEGMYIESNWELGDAVLWKDVDEKTIVEGEITKLDVGKILRFTVFDVEQGRFEVGEEDGITFQLDESDSKTILHVRHGDFSKIPEGKKYYDMTIGVWDKVLVKIKELAENEVN